MLKKNLLAFDRFVVGVVLMTFGASTVGPFAPASAQAEGLIAPSSAYHPAILQGVKIFPDEPLRFDFVIDKADSPLTGDALKAEYSKIIKYFLTSLTVPEEDLWVNLSPYEKDRIVPEKFGQTEMGRDLLAQDYFLKQLTASLMYPEGEVGKKFWDGVYRRAQEKLGTTQIPVNTFNKVWIIPDRAQVYENGDVAFVTDSHLKVMLEEDLKAKEFVGASKTTKDSELSTQIVREIILPEIEREVNNGKSFASLRQIYHSLILAIWFKRNLKESFVGQVYVEKNKITGVDIEDKQAKEKIYDQYLEAFKKGVYNYIKEEVDPATKQLIPRKYFSGGTDLGQAEGVVTE
ncbi:MAG: hypothetical protein NUV91_03175, partial [Candidatus Omnitrophica bacterium]|nr:hypothetical protein [Candidatus Omnitrophota bacterium]